MYVTPERLNLRRWAPRGPVIAVLPRGRAMRVTGPDQAGWVKVALTHPDTPKAPLCGVVSARYLTGANIPARQALAQAALAEWRRFDCGAGHEAVSPYAGFIGEMWRALGERDVDGTRRDRPWSAAALSWIVRSAAGQAPALGAFPFSSGHWRYIKAAITSREAGEAAPFWGRRLDEAPAAIGDVVVQHRKGDPARFTCENVASYEAARACAGSFASHCDIVVGLAAGQALAIGGNVSHTMMMRSYALDAQGRFTAANGAFMILQCQA